LKGGDALVDFDKIKEEIPKEIQQKKKELDIARESKDFEKSDKIRKEIEDLGYKIKNTPKGSTLSKY